MHNSLWRPVKDLLSSAQKDVIIVSAFIRSDILDFLLSGVPKNVKISIYARWRGEDIASRASNIEVLDVVKKYHARMKVHYYLHAKIYIADNAALVGSANATQSGLGKRLDGKNNLEILIKTAANRSKIPQTTNCSKIPQAANCSEIFQVLGILEKEALAPRRFTNKEIQWFKDIKDTFSQEVHVDSIDNWLPSSSPKAVLQVVHGKGRLTDDAIKDCYLLEVGAGTNKARMGEIVRSRYIFSVLNDALMNDYHDALPDGTVIQVISNSFSVKTNYAENKWNILKEWIDMFSDDMYIGKGETSSTELRRGQRLNLDRNLSLITIPTTEKTMSNFPKSDRLNIAVFFQTLDNTTTANKFLWTLSILDILEFRKHKRDSKILFAEISCYMVKIAIPPLYRFHLRFGKGEGKGADHTKRNLDNIFKQADYKNDMPIFDPNDMYALPEFNEVFSKLRGYVPYRWLAPFLVKDLNNVENDWKKRGVIIKGAQNRFSSESPVPYRIVGKGKNAFIEFNDAWKKYIVSNMAFIRSWAMEKWVDFLQRRNPGVPNIVNKLAMSHGRPPVSDQRDFWNEVLRCKKEQGSEFFCIYSGHPITGDRNYDLDHYIPWSYIGHCHLWNLIPVAKEVNLKKGSNLPANKYLRPFVEAQYDALQIYHTHFNSKLQDKWEHLVAAYSEDLSLPDTKSISVEHLQESYKNVMKPTITLAEESGFTPNWKLKKKK